MLLLAASAAQPAIAAVRLFYLHRLAKPLPSRTVEIARRHEAAFAIGACASLAAMSLWTLLSFCVTRETFTQFLGVTMTIAYAFGMLMSRSYAIYRGVNLQLVVAFLPLTAAMFVAGGWYPVAIIVGICAASSFHERLFEPPEGQFHGGGRRATRRRLARRAAGHRPQQHVARAVHDRRGRTPHPRERSVSRRSSGLATRLRSPARASFAVSQTTSNRSFCRSRSSPVLSQPCSAEPTSLPT